MKQLNYLKVSGNIHMLTYTSFLDSLVGQFNELKINDSSIQYKDMTIIYIEPLVYFTIIYESGADEVEKQKKPRERFIGMAEDADPLKPIRPLFSGEL